MLNKREVNILLLTFAITTIIWCVVWSYAIGKISRNYESKIEMMVLNQKIGIINK
jgi:ATP/ADP translocase